MKPSPDYKPARIRRSARTGSKPFTMRFNIFYMIHKGLRAILYDAATNIQRVDFNNEEEAEAALKEVSSIVDWFDHHAHIEDNQIFPAVMQYEPSVVDAFEKEHIKDHELSEKLRVLVNMYYSLTKDAERIQLGSALRKSYIEFMVFNLEHMAKEEDIINNLLWRYYTDEELIGISKQVTASLSPETLAWSTPWIMKGLSNQEIVGWLKSVEKTAPQQVFDGLFSVAENELPGHRFHQVVEGLTEGVMLA